MSSNFTVIYDACVLYPAPLRDFLMRLALTDLYRAKWTDMIHDEWTRNVLKQRPDLKAGDLERTRSLMNAALEHAVTHVEDVPGSAAGCSAWPPALNSTTNSADPADPRRLSPPLGCLDPRSPKASCARSLRVRQQ